MTRVSHSLLHTFSSSVQLTKESYFFRSMELDSWLSSNLKKTTKIFLTIHLVLILSTYLLAFLQFQHGRLNLSVDVRHLRSRTCDVIFCFEITSGCPLWVKNVSCLKLLLQAFFAESLLGNLFWRFVFLYALPGRSLFATECSFTEWKTADMIRPYFERGT